MHSGPSKQRQRSRSSSRRQSQRSRRSSTSSQGSQQRQPSPKPEATRPPAPVTAPPAQQDIIQSAPPVATQSQPPKLHGEENLRNLPPDNLKNKYGKFQVQRGMKGGPQPYGRSYSTEIEMNPNIRTRSSESLGTRGSEIDFVQTVRSGTGEDWKTTAADHGYQTDESGKAINEEKKPMFAHRAELTEQETGTGWRVDQSLQNSPFHQETHEAGAAGRHHLLKRNEPARLTDRPAVAGPGYKFDAMSTAMDKKTGKEFGTVMWGFNVNQNDQGESTITDRTPTLLEDNLKLDGPQGEEARQWDLGRRTAFDRWDQAAPGKEQANRERAQYLASQGVERQPEQVTRIPRRG